MLTKAASETAYAKINLALHVRVRRPDGYHEIESLFAFCEHGDELLLEPAAVDSLSIDGPFSDGLSSGPDNLVMRAVEMMRRYAQDRRFDPVALRLDKRLPVAAGIGGGSADAAAAIRLLDRHWQACGDNKELCLSSGRLGADVPACIVSQTRMGRGLGNDLSIVEAVHVTGTPVLLVNPLIACPTGPVFAGWDGVDRGPLDPTNWREGRNDLQAPAVRLVPQIGEVLAALKELAGTVLVRMSGSGATCFALFNSMDQMQSAAIRIADDHPEWWVMGGQIR